MNNTIAAQLSCGLRVVCRRTDSRVSYIGAVVNAGSRDEHPDREGLAHFVEHTIFKGTGRRRSWHISNRMECVGGELNAYTSKEETVVYTCAPAGYEDRALELLGDIISDSRFPAAEIDREREVVIEEIKSYLDSPGENVYDMFEERIYAGSGLAHNILGDTESVRRLTGEDCRDFLSRHYTPGNMVLYAATPQDPAKVIRIMERRFGSLHRPDTPKHRIQPGIPERFEESLNLDGHQAHTVCGVRVFGRKDPRRFALFLLNNMLGGPCMNSLLNQELRDRRGLVYTVESNVALLSDTGLLSIYFGSDIREVSRCKRLVTQTLDRLASSPLSERKFNAVKEQYCGQLIVGSDNRESMAMSAGKSLLYFGEVARPERMAERVREVTAEQFRAAAEMCAGMSSLTIY